MAEKKLTRTITAVVSERTSPFPPVSTWPLIYSVEVIDPNDDQEILRQIADKRYDDIGCQDDEDGTQSDVVYEIMNGLELHFTFEGDQTTLSDFRGS